jgi:hypothetical protein
MSRTQKLISYATTVVLALVGVVYFTQTSPSNAQFTDGSDGPVYLYDGNYDLEVADFSWNFDAEVYGSEAANNASDAFTCPATSTGAYTFISNRGQERAGLNGWNAAASQIFPAGSKNLLEVNLTPAANIIPILLPQSSIKAVGGQYSLGVACTTNNGVTVSNAWYRYIDVTPVTGEWVALPNSDGSGGGGGGGGEEEEEPVDPTLGLGTEGLTLSPATSTTWSKNSLYYNLDVRSFSSTSDFKGVTARISALKNLGVGVLVLEPIFPVSDTGKPGTIGDIYAPSTTDSINPELGTEADLIELITAAHAADIKVMLTWVSGHIGNDSSWINDKPDWFQYSGLSTIKAPGKPYATLLDYSVPELRAELITQMKKWVTKFDIDGFASANAAKQTSEFWNEATYRLNLVRPMVFLTNSPVTESQTKNSFSAVKRSDLLTTLGTLSKGTTTSTTWATALKNLVTASKTATNVNFTTDTATAALGKTDATRFGKYLNSAIALSFVAPGAPMLNAGQEIAYAKALKPFDANSIAWPAAAPATTTFITKLSKLRKTNTVLLTGAATSISTASKSVFAFKRSSSAGTVIYLGNLSAKAITTKVTFGSKLSVYDFTTGKKVSLASSQNVTVPANGFVIYSTKQVR